MTNKNGLLCIMIVLFTTGGFALESFMTGVQKAEAKNTFVFGTYLVGGSSQGYGLTSLAVNTSIHFSVTDDLTIGIMGSTNEELYLQTILRLTKNPELGIPELSFANSIGINGDSKTFKIVTGFPVYLDLYILKFHATPHLELANYYDDVYTFQLSSGMTFGVELEIPFLTLGMQSSFIYEPLISNIPSVDKYQEFNLSKPTRKVAGIYVELKI